jgi:hypothetical protein
MCRIPIFVSISAISQVIFIFKKNNSFFLLKMVSH